MCVCVYVYKCTRGCPNRPEEGIGSPEPGVVGGCEPCVCWELNSGPLKEQQAFLAAEPSLQPYAGEKTPQETFYLSLLLLLVVSFETGSHSIAEASLKLTAISYIRLLGAGLQTRATMPSLTFFPSFF